jgi:protein-disulfide isomerase
MKSDQIKNYVIVALVTALLVLGGVWIRDSLAGPKAAPSVPGVPTAPGVAPPSVATGLSAEGNYFKGDENAPVTLYEFSDFQCPFCARFFQDALPQIEENYIRTGKVKLVYKDYPLDNIHPQATPAAIAARCAGDQGKFWEMHDLIFTNQQSLSDGNYNVWASQLGLNADTFSQCLNSRQHLSAVRKDLLEGQQAGVRGTPGFVLNGQVISGAQPYQVFAQAIDAALP